MRPRVRPSYRYKEMKTKSSCELSDLSTEGNASAHFCLAAHLSRSTPATMSKQHCRMLQVERFFRQSRNKMNIFNLFRLCRKDEISFDIAAVTGNIVAETTGNIVAKNGNNVEATLDFVEGTKFYDKLVRHCCRFWQQLRMLLRQSRTLFRHCC